MVRVGQQIFIVVEGLNSEQVIEFNCLGSAGRESCRMLEPKTMEHQTEVLDGIKEQQSAQYQSHNTTGSSVNLSTAIYDCKTFTCKTETCV